MAVFVWHTDSKTLTLIKEFAPGRETVAHGVVAGMYEKDKHESPLQAAKYEVSGGFVQSSHNSVPRSQRVGSNPASQSLCIFAA